MPTFPQKNDKIFQHPPRLGLNEYILFLRSRCISERKIRAPGRRWKGLRANATETNLHARVAAELQLVGVQGPWVSARHLPFS